MWDIICGRARRESAIKFTVNEINDLLEFVRKVRYADLVEKEKILDKLTAEANDVKETCESTQKTMNDATRRTEAATKTADEAAGKANEAADRIATMMRVIELPGEAAFDAESMDIIASSQQQNAFMEAMSITDASIDGIMDKAAEIITLAGVKLTVRTVGDLAIRTIIYASNLSVEYNYYAQRLRIYGRYGTQNLVLLEKNGRLSPSLP